MSKTPKLTALTDLPGRAFHSPGRADILMHLNGPGRAEVLSGRAFSARAELYATPSIVLVGMQIITRLAATWANVLNAKCTKPSL